MNLLDKIKITGGEKINSGALYSLDRDWKKTPDDANLAQGEPKTHNTLATCIQQILMANIVLYLTVKWH